MPVEIYDLRPEFNRFFFEIFIVVIVVRHQVGA